jgi:hypothetical protein
MSVLSGTSSRRIVNCFAFWFDHEAAWSILKAFPSSIIIIIILFLLMQLLLLLLLFVLFINVYI